jgi:hypothetical protein
MTNKYKKFFDKLNSYYDSINEDMQHKINGLNNKNNYEYVFDQKNGSHIVGVYLDDKLIMKAEYCCLGMYNVQLSVWYWSWTIAFVNNALIEAPIDKVKGFKEKINDKYEKFDKVEAEMLQYLLSNDSFYISIGNMDKIIKLGLYLIGGIWYFPVKKDGDKVEYIIITKILQY